VRHPGATDASSAHRAALVADFYGVAAYASINGVLALTLTIARAAAPVAAAPLHAASGSYQPVMAAVAACPSSRAWPWHEPTGGTPARPSRRLGGHQPPVARQAARAAGALSWQRARLQESS
jgi:hypothetical protein